MASPDSWSLTGDEEAPTWVVDRAAAEQWPEGTLELRRNELSGLGLAKVDAYFSEDGTLSWIDAGSVYVDLEWTDFAPLGNALSKALKQLRKDQKKANKRS